jgi:hypothetical protein
MFCVPTLQENGTEAFDLYSVKQPLPVNFTYSVSIICSKYELLNEFNTMMHHEFNALECYLAPNGYFMPMTLENITDESEYAIDDRKYYSQTFQIKLMGYVIRKEDFIVTHLPSRLHVRILDSDKKKKYKKIRKNDNWLGELENSTTLNKEHEEYLIEESQLPNNDYTKDWLDDIEDCPLPDTAEMNPPKHPFVDVDEYEDCCDNGDDKEKYVRRKIRFNAEFPYCDEHETSFVSQYDAEIEAIETTNVYDFVIKINGNVIDLDDEVTIQTGDDVYINISREDEYKDSKLVIVCGDLNEVIDTEYDPESALDEVEKEKNIDV